VDHPHGFYTAEIRKGGQRVGFRLVTFAGEKAVIAHVGLPKTYRVSKYGVDVAAVDQASDALLNPGATLYLVDEIGKMECLSPRFVERMKELLDSKSTVVATVASLRAVDADARQSRCDADGDAGLVTKITTLTPNYSGLMPASRMILGQ
jgi:nucleoside-triphosphatase THEP1